MNRLKNITEDIEDVEAEPEPYAILKFVSILLGVLGFMVIAVGWFFAYSFSLAFNSEKIVGGQITLFFGIGLVATILGMLIIATGQIYLALLDIRNDVHVTKKFVRRFGFAIFESLDSNSALGEQL